MKLEHQLQLQHSERSHKAQVVEMEQRMSSEIRHSQGIHKMELQATQQRNQENEQLAEQQHQRHLQVFELHNQNALKLQTMMVELKNHVDFAQALTTTVSEDREKALRDKEEAVEQKLQTVTDVLDQIVNQKEAVEKERARLLSVLTTFELSMASFQKDHEEERMRLQQAQVKPTFLAPVFIS